MKDKIELNWTLNLSYTFPKYDVFESLVDLFDTYEIVPENVDYSSYVIDWLNTNLKDYVEDFLTTLDPVINVDGDISYNNVTNLLDDEEFMKEFRDYLND